jgi:hypothetical protein
MIDERTDLLNFGRAERSRSALRDMAVSEEVADQRTANSLMQSKIQESRFE